jgi:hypothetical protein
MQKGVKEGAKWVNWKNRQEKKQFFSRPSLIPLAVGLV